MVIKKSLQTEIDMSRKLEITVLSAEDLRRTDRKPVRKNAFVVVKIDAFNSRTTRPDESGGSYPTWNEKMEMEMPVKGRIQFVSIEAYRLSSSGNVKKLGSARMPVTDFMGGYAPEGYLHFLSYRLRNDIGDRNGIINVSARVKVDERLRKAAVDVSACSSQAVVTTGYGGRVVTGVPVWYGYQARG